VPLDKNLQRNVLNDVTRSLASSENAMDPLAFPSNVEQASQDFSADKGTVTWTFLAGLASSRTFRQEFWYKRPLLI